ncbi:MAG: serine--tRNA ligase, partial [Neofamilia sp.]
MIDIRLIRENPEVVKENIKRKFQDEKLELVDKVRELDEEFRAKKTRADELRGDRNRV